MTWSANCDNTHVCIQTDNINNIMLVLVVVAFLLLLPTILLSSSPYYKELGTRNSGPAKAVFSPDGSLLALSYYGNSTQVLTSTGVNSWTFNQTITPNDTTGSSPNFGVYQMLFSQDNTKLIISGPGDNNSLGATWIFQRNPTTLQYYQLQPKLVGLGAQPSNEVENQGYVISCDLQCSTIAVGTSSLHAETVWIYFSKTSIYSEVAQLYYNASGFGNAVSLSGDGTYLLVGAFGANSNIGLVVPYKKLSNGTWIVDGKPIVPTDYLGTITQFGAAIQINQAGNMAVIGGPGDGNSILYGAAWVYLKNNGVWEEFQKIAAPADLTAYNNYGYFGFAVNMNGDGDFIYIASGTDTNYTGATFVYRKNTTTGKYYEYQPKLVGTPHLIGSMQNFYGISVTSSGSLISISSPSGAYWIFALNGTFSPSQSLPHLIQVILQHLVLLLAKL